MKKLFTLLICALLSSASIFADEPFRNHRYDSFKVLSTNSESIVFIGNSITNMNEWWETFSSNPNVMNRGVSGAITDEALANIEAVAAGKPAKVFFMLGTNDLGTAGINNVEHVLKNMTLLVDRLQKTSPDTEIYIQSILPSTSGLRTLEIQSATNDALKALCEERNITYIDLWNELMSITQNSTHTLDGLHLKASGYQVWAKKIAQYVGSACTYPDNCATEQNANGIGNAAYGMRATVFSMLPVNDGDVLIIGDEMIHGGEWHELLQSNKVKSRGTGWGYPGPGLDITLKEIPLILNTRSGSCNPLKIFLYAGVSDVNNSNNTLATVETNYKNVVNKIKELAPNAQIVLMSLQPRSTQNNNTSRVVPFNEKIKAIADGDSQIEYLDIYTDFADNNVGKSEYFKGDYLYGMGYVKVAQKIATVINDANIVALTDEQATSNYRKFELRSALGNAIVKAASLKAGDGIGEYSAESLANLNSLLERANNLLIADNVNEEDLEELATSITAAAEEAVEGINKPKASTATEEYWYQITSLRSNDRYITAKGAATGVAGESNSANSATSMWKFVDRGDNTYDIVNREYKSYLSPVANYNTQVSTTITRPERGWTISYSNTPSYYIISSGDVQLNQTGDGQNFTIYNWSNNATLGNDRNDAGCQLYIMEAGEIQEPEDIVLPTAVLTLTEENMAGSMPYQLTDEEAEKVFALESYTIFLDVTLNSSMTGRGAFVCAADPSKPITTTATPTSTPYFALGHYGANLAHLASTKDSDRFTVTGAGLSTGQSAKIVFTANRTAKSKGVVNFYINGANKGSFTYPLSNYELPAFCDIKSNHENANIYIGGGMANNAAYEICDATIHSVKFYDSVLTDEQIVALNTGEKVEYASEISYSTESDKTWYYIVSASNLDYCSGKAIQTNGDGAFTYNNVRLDPSMIWCFEKNSDGKVAIRNYNGKYMSKTQDKNHANAGLVDEPHYNYTITSWSNEAALPNAFTIKSDASNQPIHAQKDNVVIVTWAASNNGASLWSFRKLSDEELNTEVKINNLTIEHSAMGVGIGGKDYALLRIKPAITGIKGNKTLDAISGSVNSENVERIKIYKVNDMFEYHAEKANSELLGTATPDNSGNFKVTFTPSIQITNTASTYYWVVADIKDTAKEGDIIDAEITSYAINGKEESVRNGNPANNAIVFLSASTVEYLNTNGSRYYRIPALTTAKNGWLVAVTDKRWGSDGDLPNNIDVVARVSKDNGVTWSEQVTIAGTDELGGDYGHGDPAIVTDMETGDIHVLICSKEGFFYATPNSPQLIKVITSHDNGETWDAPIDITNQLYGAGCDDSQRKTIHSLFPSSGSFIQTRDGKLMCVAPTRPTSSTTHSTFQARIISSSDHGKTWTLSNNYAMLDADESKIVELDNGDLLVASRHAGNRYYAVSSDGGTSWSTRSTWSELSEPGCNGDMIRLTSLSAGDDKNRLLHTIPNAGSRQNVSIFLSTDEGKTWPTKKSICPKVSAYSSLTVLPDGTIGCYYEEGALEGGYQMRFVRFSLEWITDGKDSIVSDNFNTGIGYVKEMTKNAYDNTIYDLQGRKVITPVTGGIYIQNGKKFIAK